MMYQLANQGSVFATRPRARQVLADLHEQLDPLSGPALELDFEGVRDVSYSFADELVGTLVQRACDAEVEIPILVNVAPEVLATIRLNLDTRELPLRERQLTPA